MLALAAVLRITAPEPAHAQYPPPNTSEPPTSAPATDPPPTTAPPPTQRRRDEEEPVAPAPVTAVPSPDAPEATRTRRPTRTPRTTATPIPTPAVAAALRLTLAQDAPAAGGKTVRWLIQLTNQGLTPAQDVTLELTLPAAVALANTRSTAGQTIREAGVVRWYVPLLEPGATVDLMLDGTLAQALDADSRLCALLLSDSSPLEHCFALRLATAAAEVDTSPRFPGSAPTPLSPEPAPAVTRPDPGLAGWGLVLVGLAVLGGWIGLRLASPRRPADGAPD